MIPPSKNRNANTSKFSPLPVSALEFFGVNTIGAKKENAIKITGMIANINNQNTLTRCGSSEYDAITSAIGMLIGISIDKTIESGNKHAITKPIATYTNNTANGKFQAFECVIIVMTQVFLVFLYDFISDLSIFHLHSDTACHASHFHYRGPRKRRRERPECKARGAVASGIISTPDRLIAPASLLTDVAATG